MYEANDGSPFGAIMLMVILAVYAYFAFAQYKIAQKAGHSSPWMAWIPIANLFQLIDIAGKQWFWILLLFVPFVNIICFAILWAEAAKRIGCSEVWGWLTILPFINFVSIGVMAFGSGSPQVSGSTQGSTQGSGSTYVPGDAQGSGHNPPAPPKPEEHREPHYTG